MERELERERKRERERERASRWFFIVCHRWCISDVTWINDVIDCVIGVIGNPHRVISFSSSLGSAARGRYP